MSDEKPKEDSYYAARAEFEKFFLRADGEARAAEITDKFTTYITDEIMRAEIAQITDIDTFLSRAQDVARSGDKEKCVTGLMEIFTLFHNLQLRKPEMFKAFRERNFVFDAPSTKINEILTYNIIRGDLQIHVEDVPAVPLIDKLHLFRKGLPEVAQIVEKDPAIKIVSATSWIVAEQPSLVKKLGFTIIGPIGEEELKGENFDGETRPVHRAVISREDFLKRYLKS